MHEKEKTSRRNFLKKSSLTGVGLLTIPQLVSTAFAEETRSKKSLFLKTTSSFSRAILSLTPVEKEIRQIRTRLLHWEAGMR
jgi:hypothetical protein